MKVAAAIIAGLFVAQAHADGMGVVRNMSENKFVSVPGLPTCVTQAVESGDPSKGPSMILFKAKAGCAIPWHWHTPTEQIMVVSGKGQMEMKDDGGATVLGPGGYAMMPSKHVHRFKCISACTAFVTGDAAFDIHYLDPDGKEISPEIALGKK